MKNPAKNLYRLGKAMLKDPGSFSDIARVTPSVRAARNFSEGYKDRADADKTSPGLPRAPNPLWNFFQERREGHGIWKWEHYFDIYHRHFSRFIGEAVTVLEIGVYSGGSLEMWRSYFGAKSSLYGIDIEEACKTYENDHTSILIGDQADRKFWERVRGKLPGIDILIDDGGHKPEQQRITLEEMLPSLNPGGVFLCEDIHGSSNDFCAYATSLVNSLNQRNKSGAAPHDTPASPFQSCIHSIHFYPYVVVIEKHLERPTRLSAPKHGTLWQPFL